MEASLRFRVADVNETFDLTIRGPFFFRRGKAADWDWDEFYLNGVKWKGRTLPKLPILAAGEGHDAAARHPADRGLRVRARRRDATSTAGRAYRDQLHARRRDRRRQADLPRQGLDRHARRSPSCAAIRSS